MTDPATAVQDDLSGLSTQLQAQLRLEETPTDTGNAYRVSRLLSNRVRYVPAEDNWLVWDGTRLRREDFATVLNLTIEVCQDVRQYSRTANENEALAWRRWADTTESVARRKAMLELAGTLPALSVRAELLDSQAHLLNTPGGTIDVDTLQTHPCRIEDLITRSTRTPLDLTVVRSALLDDYINTFVPEAEHWAYLMKMLGATLRGGNPFRLWPILHGPSTSGKTQLIEAVASSLGDYAVAVSTSVFRANQDDKPRPDLLRAIPARFVYAEEGSQAWELHGDHVKRLTGGDPIVARGMRSNLMVERIPSFTPLIICNELPRVRDADPALRRRLRVLELGHSVLGREIISRRAEFQADLDTSQALLTQLILGCQRAYHGGGLDDMPDSWVRSTLSGFDELNHVGSFVSHMREHGWIRDVSEDVPAQACWKGVQLHGRYRMWVEMYGGADDRRQMLSLRDLNKALHAQGWHSTTSNGLRWLGKLNVDEIEAQSLTF